MNNDSPTNARPPGLGCFDRSYDAALQACAAAGQGKRATSLVEEMAALAAQSMGQGGEGGGGERDALFSSVGRPARRVALSCISFLLWVGGGVASNTRAYVWWCR